MNKLNKIWILYRQGTFKFIVANEAAKLKVANVSTYNITINPLFILFFQNRSITKTNRINETRKTINNEKNVCKYYSNKILLNNWIISSSTVNFHCNNTLNNFACHHTILKSNVHFFFRFFLKSSSIYHQTTL